MDEKVFSAMASFKVFRKTTNDGLKTAYVRGVKQSTVLFHKSFENSDFRENSEESCVIPRGIGSNFNEIEREFLIFTSKWAAVKKKPIFSNKVVNQEYKTSFSTDDYSLVVCVSEDFCMETGIEFQFKCVFQKLAQLLNQHQKCGGMAVLKDGLENRFLYYLVARRLYTDNMSFFYLFSSLLLLKNHIRRNNVTHLAIPDVVSWLKKSERLKILYLLEYLFNDINLEIVWCHFFEDDMNVASPVMQFVEMSNFTNLNDYFVSAQKMSGTKGSIIIYLSSEDGFVSEEMNILNSDVNFLDSFQSEPKTVGDVIEHKSTKFLKLYGFIVKRKWREDELDFLHLQNCFNFVRINRRLSFRNLLFFTVPDESDTKINTKIVNVLKNTFYYDNIHVFYYNNH